MIPCVYGERLERMRRDFELLYGPACAAECIDRLFTAIGRYGVGIDCVADDSPPGPADMLLITYADAICAQDAPPLAVLRRFLNARLKAVFNTVHLLPFYPWSSDDGFSVKDYRGVQEAYGDWGDIVALGRDFRLMFDLVLNHASAKGEWFRDYLNGICPGRKYFIEVDPGADLSKVVRPRTSALLSKVHTKSGQKQVWSTFGGDQMDLNFANPNLLFEFVDILLFYLSKGARIFRLDAIAYLWKTPGTDCIHLPQTHAVVRLLRELLGLVAPDARLLTETNVPHEENIRYFGQGDEAHWVYQFPLPPLLLHAFHKQDARVLTRWAAELPPPPTGCTYLNFTASHDGIGLRPLQGLVPDADLDLLATRIEERQGAISRKRNADGSESPYELNISFLDALSGLEPKGKRGDRRRFLTSQAIMLALQGIPAVYYHSLFGTRNDLRGMRQSGMPRRINRRKFEESELARRLDDPRHEAHDLFNAYCAMLGVRAAQPAFAPDAAQSVLELHPACFALRRRCTSQTLYCLSNLSAETLRLPCGGELAELKGEGGGRDLLTGADAGDDNGALVLAPWQTRWIDCR